VRRPAPPPRSLRPLPVHAAMPTPGGRARFRLVATVSWLPRRLYVYTALECRGSLMTSSRRSPPSRINRVVAAVALTEDR